MKLSEHHNPALSVNKVRTWYPSPEREPILVLDGVSFSVLRGTVTAIVGPSGCGKSTMLRIASGVESPKEGFVQIGGLATTTAVVPMISQSPALLPWRTVRQNISLGLELSGIADHERIAAEACQKVGLT